MRAVITGQEIRGHFMGKKIRDMPVLCWDVVRFVGDRVAAVAADTAEAAEEALTLIQVEYEQLQAIFDPLEAMGPDAPVIHEDVAGYDGAPKERLALDVPNGLTRLAWQKGDVEQGFGEADLMGLAWEVLNVENHCVGAEGFPHEKDSSDNKSS